ncbi:lipoprotein-releasing ABC transporter permease subunit [bacterium]|nr:lipoprotein-releasing ABC transporter permease subunit [bacterium]
MSFEFFIANRYLRAKRKTGFISVITYFSIGGVLIGVAALIIVLSVMNGFESEVRTRIVGFDAHIRIRKYQNAKVGDYRDIIDKVRNIENVTGCAPYIIEHAIIQTKKPQTVFVKGTDPELERYVSRMDEYVISGEMNFAPKTEDGTSTMPGILLGKGLASRLMVQPGDKVLLISPAGLNLTGGSFQQPKVKHFQVTGIFESGLSEYDENVALCSIPDAQNLFFYGDAVGGVEVKLDDLDAAEFVAGEIQDVLGYPYLTQTWFERNRTLFSWMKIEKWAAFVILSLIIIVAAFNIISSLIMVVLEKTREIGVIKAMGGSEKSVMRIFMFEGLVVGFVGTFIGSLLGFLLCWSQLQFKWFSLPGDIYFINALPIEMHWQDFAFISAAAIGLCLIASIYPAWKASRMDPVEAIRYE